MKNLKSIVTFITIAAIFCLSLSQNIFAEETHMAYKLRQHRITQQKNKG